MLTTVSTPSQSSTVCSTSGPQSREMGSDRRSTDTSVERRQKKSTKSVDDAFDGRSLGGIKLLIGKIVSAVKTPSESSTVCSTSAPQSQEMHSDQRSTDTSVERRQNVDDGGSLGGINLLSCKILLKSDLYV